MQDAKILIVENINHNQQIFRDTFGQYNSLTFATNYVEALRSLSVQQFEFVFINLTEPEMGGMDTTESISRILKHQMHSTVIFGMIPSNYDEPIREDVLAEIIRYPLSTQTLVESTTPYDAFEMV